MSHDIPRASALQHQVHAVLLGGVLVSALVLVIGLALSLRAGSLPAPAAPPTFGQLLPRAIAGDRTAVLDLGLLLLMLTPALRVTILAIGWLTAGQTRFALVALAVLLLLALSFALAARA